MGQGWAYSLWDREGTGMGLQSMGQRGDRAGGQGWAPMGISAVRAWSSQDFLGMRYNDKCRNNYGLIYRPSNDQGD